MGLFKPKRGLDGTIAGHLTDAMSAVKELFPGDTKLTLVIRSERYKEPLILTNDSPEQAIAAIRKMTTASPNLHLAN
jgi:hypothetical protein